MVLGTSDVRLIDMTRAFASVGNKGVRVVPYGIRKVVTADGRLLYQHDNEKAACSSLPGCGGDDGLAPVGSADRHRPRRRSAGRSRARPAPRAPTRTAGSSAFRAASPPACGWAATMPAPIAGLQGGTAPARAFHDFMAVAVARRPVEQFETQVPMPDWQLTPEEEMYGDVAFDAMVPLVDENGIRSRPPQVIRNAGSSSRMIRPDGTGDPTSRSCDQALPTRQAPQPQQPSASQPQRPHLRSVSAAADPRKTRPNPLQRGHWPPPGGTEQPRLERLELRAVIQMYEMRHFMCDDVSPHLRRSEDQPPAEPDPPDDEQLPQRRAASPTLTAAQRHSRRLAISAVSLTWSRAPGA